MSSDPASPAVTWPVLTLAERRVLGVLVEKAKTTPDTYPLSVNALVTGCNQKSNRDPILNLSETDVEEALAGAQQKGLAIKITGGRVVRWRHALYEAFAVDKVELAVLAELLLRGPQTEGELRARAARMEPIADLDAVRGVLRPLAERRLIVYLSPEGRRGTTLTHGFHAADELEGLRSRHASEGLGPVPPGQSMARQSTNASPQTSEVIRASEVSESADVQAEIDALGARVSKLQASVAALTEEVRQLKDALGIARSPG
jgi:uncharacterized protein YceH (UPF0502 family)